MDQANILARDLQYEAPELDGRTMLRTWGEVVEAAGQVWRQLPARSDLVAGMDVMNQLEESATSVHRSLRASAQTQVDPTLQEIGQLIARAAGIIERSDLSRRPRTWSRPQLQDAFAARVSLIHTVYLSAHAVSTGLTATSVAEYGDPRLRKVHAVPAEHLRQSMAAVEEIALSYLDGHYPGALDRRHRTPVDDDRLGAAVSAWDVHTRRVLARDPSSAGMATAASGMVTAAAAAHHLWAAAAATGHVDPSRFQDELSPAMETTVQRWGAAHTLWKTLRHPHEKTDPKMSEATRELNAAMLELAWDGSGPATTQAIAGRADLSVVVRALHRFQATAAGLSQVIEDTTATGQFTANPRTATKLVQQKSDPDDRSAIVSPKAIHTGAAIPMPVELKARLGVLVGGAANASRSAMRASMAVSDKATMQAEHPARSETRPPLTGRDREQTVMLTAGTRGPSR